MLNMKYQGQDKTKKNQKKMKNNPTIKLKSKKQEILSMMAI